MAFNFDGFTEAQKLSITHLDGPLFIAAGAGSGKTFTLQQRIAYALMPESGPALQDVDEILAITFTDKAANEIKGRVRSVLRSVGLFDQALKVDSAWISTIHSMCKRILTEHALDFGLDPSFKVIVGHEQKRFETLVLAEFLDAMKRALAEQDLSDKEFLTVFHSMSLADISQALRDLRPRLMALTDADEALQLLPPAPGVNYLFSVLNEAFQSAQIHYEQYASSSKKGGGSAEAPFKSFEAGIQKIQSQISEMDHAQLAQAVYELPKMPLRTPKLKEAFKALNAVRLWVLQNCQAHYARKNLVYLVVLAQTYAQYYEERLDDRGMLDTDSLITRCYRLLKAHPDIAQSYKSKFKLVMLDEFQDTDQLQLDLVRLIAQDRYLCTVGDAQQSIYRFRGADVSVFNSLRQEFQKIEGAQIVNLDANFRSEKEILSLTREVCSQDAVFGTNFLDLSAHRHDPELYKGEGPRLNIFTAIHKHQKGPKLSDARQRCAQEVAQRFADLREAGQKPSDMVVLMGAMTHASLYAEALREQGFDCVMVGGKDFYNKPEIQALYALLRLLANPHNTESLLRFCKSSWVNLSPRDLLLMSTRESDGVLKTSSLERGITQPLAGMSKHALNVQQLLARAQSKIGVRPVSRIVFEFVQDLGLLRQLEQEGSNGKVTAANILKGLRILEEAEFDNVLGVTELADYFDTLCQDPDVQEGQACLSLAEQNAVRIMTIHKSKGLQFPCVAVVEFDRSKRGSGTDIEMLTTNVEGRARLLLNLKQDLFDDKLDTPETEYLPANLEPGPVEFVNSLHQIEAQDEAAEAQRLLYVALTRASDYLLIAGPVKELSKGLTLGPLLDDIRSGIYGADNPFPLTGDTRTLPDGSVLEFSCCNLSLEMNEQVNDSQKTPESEDAASGEELALVEDGTKDQTELLPEGAQPYWNHELEQAELERCERESTRDERTESSEEHAAALEASPYRFRKNAAGAFTVVPSEAPFPAAYTQLNLAQRPERGIVSYSSIAAGHTQDNSLSAQGGLAQVELIGCTPKEESRAGNTEIQQQVPATQFGSAFHRIAQYAVESRGKYQGCLRLPEEKRFDLLMQTYELPLTHRARLLSAAVRWFDSSLARKMETFPELYAEYPFVVELPVGEAMSAGQKPLYLEGEIDLLGIEGAHAWVVDYKTGGQASETPQELIYKHELQAACYAYALMREGLEVVDLAFARVEIGPVDPDESLAYIHYHFEKSDLELLEDFIRANQVSAKNL